MGIQPTILETYEDFIMLVEQIGFLPLSENAISFPSLSGLTHKYAWHTDLDTDPWNWKVNYADVQRGAYAKLFNKKPGFIANEWYPHFISVRRQGHSFDSMYECGMLSHYAKQIYDLFSSNQRLATHEIKRLAGFNKASNSKYESAMLELQMNMFITVSGMSEVRGSSGMPHGWPATTYMTVEQWYGADKVEESLDIPYEQAMERIMERIIEYVPDADIRKMNRFIG